MDQAPSSGPGWACPLENAARLGREKVLNPDALVLNGGVTSDAPALVVLAAGKGSRFGQDPKCIQPVHGTPLARHAIDAFRRFAAAPAICVVGYRHAEVSAALGNDNVYVLSDNPAGGTAFAAYEAFSVPDLVEKNPVLIVAVGDRVVPSSVFRRLWTTHRGGTREADLTFLTAMYEPPKNRGKGRVVRNQDGRVVRIVEERDIREERDDLTRQMLLDLTEGNCPLYAIRAAPLLRRLRGLTNANAQKQYYLTDIVQAIAREGGEIRTITTTAADPEYDLLCSDVTQPMDLALLEGILASARGLMFPDEREAEEASRAISANRPAGQIVSIARQLERLVNTTRGDSLDFRPDHPVGIGLSGGRVRIAFMHPDMNRFFGPAWQMPIGAGDASGEEQIVVLTQGAGDSRIHLFPTDPKYRESVNFIPSDSDVMFPGADIADLHTYEQFGTQMSEALLLSLGYFSDEEIARRRDKGQPLPPSSLWVGSNMRRPFALVGNAIASMRTLRAGNLGARVQAHLGRERFMGLRLVTTGSIPQGGFSSSSAVTLATKNAINSLFELGIPPDLLVHLACQAEYGTGVRAGSLDQATEQKGRAGQGTLVSSNPKDNYRVMGTYPVPTDRIRVIYPYSVERDRESWRWSWGAYAEVAGTEPGLLTTGEMRKMTGKAAEIAALLVRLPLDTDFFMLIEEDLVSDGLLSRENRAWICSVLRRLPLLARREDLRQLVLANREWYAAQLMETHRIERTAAESKADAAVAGLFTGWRDARLRRATASGVVVEEYGVPLRAIVAYLFGEVAKNFFLLHHPDRWIESVAASQRGDRCCDVDPASLPSRGEMEGVQDWERDCSGADLMNRWLDRHGAAPFDFNRGIDDASLADGNPPAFEHIEGSNFFRGLALLDLVEAMLRRAFGSDAVAVRVNAAGQGDYFQVHIDTRRADPEDVKRFIRTAVYRRFGLTPSPEFVELHSGGGAVGVRLSRFDMLPTVIRRLQSVGASPAGPRA